MKGGVRNYLMKDTLLHLASGLTTKNDEMTSFSKDLEIRIIRWVRLYGTKMEHIPIDVANNKNKFLTYTRGASSQYSL